MSDSLKRRVNAIRERINIRLFDSRDNVLRDLRTAGVLVSSLTILALIYFHGFHLTIPERVVVGFIIKFSIGFYLLKYVLEFVYSFSPIQHLKETKWEGILMAFLFLNILSINIFDTEIMSFFGELLGLEALDQFFLIFIQGYFLLIVFLELGKASTFLPFASLSPPALLAISFIILILIGTGLLMLPEMTSSGMSMPFSDALFTSISASCVTGLIVVDTATYFSFKGQFIIMMLFQLGGLNIISFATFFALFTKKGIGIRHQSLIQANYSNESLTSSAELFRKIIRFTFQIEALGAILIFFFWGANLHFDSLGQRLFYSIFHSISAFNNAGFSLFTNGLMEAPIQNSYFLHLIIAIIVIFGGLGFGTIRDIFTLRQVRERMRKPWKTLSVGSRIALYSTGVLLVLGFVVFFVFEFNGTMADKSIGGQIITAIFQSATTRTAGFNTVDIGSLALPVLIFFIFLMFIGASTGSTGGGIKTTTFALVFLSAWSTIRGKKKVEIFKQTIPWELLNRAFSIFLFSVSVILVGIFVLSISDPHLGLARIAFEEVSAFCTVGLSTGITSELSGVGRTVIMLSMFIGRIGTITLAFALSSRKKESNDYKYPKANFMVG
ncbi:TrkH family potassium uptake protein [Phaeocystidibacter luteus]|uniref:ATPase n=1 Tax=Phaeocystidibacter luteus TaxID=911197 RepID=A0A6N6RF71_9FLAO|nr:potassium transporter TrkG [Phaeocystidibacter luteus]KAB2809807.1 ATPase [Phaeocystidibacter luteus]